MRSWSRRQVRLHTGSLRPERSVGPFSVGIKEGSTCRYIVYIRVTTAAHSTGNEIIRSAIVAPAPGDPEHKGSWINHAISTSSSFKSSGRSGTGGAKKTGVSTTADNGGAVGGDSDSVDAYQSPLPAAPESKEATVEAGRENSCDAARCGRRGRSERVVQKRQTSTKPESRKTKSLRERVRRRLTRNDATRAAHLKIVHSKGTSCPDQLTKRATPIGTRSAVYAMG
jgi:hypothetical protein